MFLRRSSRIPLLCLGAAAVLCADNSANIVGSGYAFRGPVGVAPGQITTFFVSGFAPIDQPISATTMPLPYNLGGISANLNPGPAARVPILSVFPVNTCLDGLLEKSLPCGTIIGVTVQIPFELQPDSGYRPPNFYFLTISDDSGHSSSTRIMAEFDRIQIRTFDSPYSAIEAAVTHADGTAVDFSHPARPGEKVVMYAAGLGATIPAVATGVASPSPAAASGGFYLNFDYRPNAMPSAGVIPPGAPATAATQPLFTGLTPGFVGLYQVNFVIPAPTGPLPRCVGPRSIGYGANPFAAVLSNLTVTLVGSSFDGAAICVSAGT